MSYIGRSFTYKDSSDSALAPFDEISIKITIPIFEYTTTDPDSIQKQTISSQQLLATIPIQAESYKIDYPVQDITGEDPAIYFQYLINAFRENRNIDDFTIEFQTNIYGNKSYSLLVKNYEALYIFEDLSSHLSTQMNSSLTDATHLPDAPRTPTFTNLILINKKAYILLANDLRSISATDNNFYLLILLSELFEMKSGYPELKTDIRRDWLKTTLGGSFGIQKIDKLINAVKEKSDSLFDFPISVPTISLLEIKGTFTILAEDGVLTIDDFNKYSIDVRLISKQSSEFITETIEQDWSTIDHIVDNVAPLSFSATDKFYRLNSRDKIIIRVKGFDGVLLWDHEYNIDDPELQSLNLKVRKYSPNILESTQGSRNKGHHKIRGRVISLSSSVSVANLTVIIQTKNKEDEFWRLMSAAETDKAGQFSTDYPYGKFTKAQAIVSLTPDNPVNIGIVSDHGENQTISDEFLYLLIEESNIVDNSDEVNDTSSTKRAARLPDDADIIGSEEYTQDMGGTCLNLTTPNRTLREYNYQAIVRISDPEVANYTLKKISSSKNKNKYRYGSPFLILKPDSINKYQLSLNTDSIPYNRKSISLDNPIRWQDSPNSGKDLNFYQAVTVATGHILHYKSVFKADGYSMGDLLYSLPLAPGQKKQIVVFDTSHTLQASENQSRDQAEGLAAGIVDDRSITDQLGGSIGESLSGKSSAKTSGVSAGLGLGGSIGAFSGALGVSGGYANANSSASQDGSRNVAQFFGETLKQALTQNAESYRRMNATIVSTVKEGQQYAVETEVVANHNHCHSLTMMYFEVLRHYAIYQELADVEECVFVPLLLTNFTKENIYKWKDILAINLLPIPSNTFLNPFSYLKNRQKHPLIKAFDAVDRINTNYRNINYPPEGTTFADEQIRRITGEISLRINIKRPKTRYDRVFSFPRINPKNVINPRKTAKKGFFDAFTAGITGGLSTLFTGPPGTNIVYDTVEEEEQIKARLFDIFMVLDDNFLNLPPAKSIRVKNFQPNKGIDIGGNIFTTTGEDFFEDGHVDKAEWEAYSNLLGYTNVYEFLDYYFSGNLISEWNRIFENDILEMVFKKLIQSMIFDKEINIDLTINQPYKGGESVIKISLEGQTSKTRRDLSSPPNKDYLKLYSNSPSIVALKNSGKVKINVEHIRITYSTNSFDGVLTNSFSRNDLLDGVNLYIPISQKEDTDPRDGDKYLANQLLEHLNSNLEHYNKVLWTHLDTDRRYMLLDGFSIDIYDIHGTLLFPPRSLASVIKNKLITITGNSLVFPVAPGYKVSPTYIIIKTDDDVEKNIELLDHYRPTKPTEPYRLSVPTRGVFMESVQGQCNACEKTEENTSQDWDKFKTDEPTSISPIVTPQPAVTDWKAKFEDFTQPLVNIQNAPNAPDPGAGLAGLNELLGKAGVFKDVTGLQGNQENVIRTYLSNQENAKAFAEMAKGMATQQHNSQHTGSITDSINSAHDNGAIDDSEYSNLTRQHLQQQIDGGESNRAHTQEEIGRGRPSLSDAAINAVNHGREVQAQRTDTAGNTESVNIHAQGEGNPSSQVNIQHRIDPIEQPSSMSCWATAATMMVNWKNQSSVTIEEILRDAGSNISPPNEERYVSIFTENNGLLASEKQEFISSLNMVGEPPANYPLSTYVYLLKNYGPLWITTDASEGENFSPHARVLIGIEGDIENDPQNVYFTFVDPANGEEVSDTFEEFVSFFEQMVTDNPSGSSLFIQIVRFRDRIQQLSEGQIPDAIHSTNSNIRNMWLFLGAVPNEAMTDPSNSWWNSRVALNPTHVVISLNSIQPNDNFTEIKSTYKNNNWEILRRFLVLSRARNITPHLMLFVDHHGANLTHLDTYGSDLDNLMEIIDRKGEAKPASIILDAEGWWTGGTFHGQGGNKSEAETKLINGIFEKDWKDELQMGIGITHLGYGFRTVRNLLSIANFSIPQIYGSPRNVGRPVNNTKVRYYCNKSKAELPENGFVIAGLTANKNILRKDWAPGTSGWLPEEHNGDPRPTVNRNPDYAAQINRNCVESVLNITGIEHISYWSDKIIIDQGNELILNFISNLGLIIKSNERLTNDNLPT